MVTPIGDYISIDCYIHRQLDTDGFVTRDDGDTNRWFDRSMVASTDGYIDRRLRRPTVISTDG